MQIYEINKLNKIQEILNLQTLNFALFGGYIAESLTMTEWVMCHTILYRQNSGL